MKNTFYLIIALTLIQRVSLAQKYPIKPMHKFMQANADSTLVLEFTSSWIHEPEYYLLSKKGDTISCYTYKNPPRRQLTRQIPRNIGHAIYKQRFNIFSAPVDINSFFSPYSMSSKRLNRFWHKVSKLKPWTLTDDSTDGKGCPPIPQKGNVIRDNNIYDGGGIQLYLITKEQIKILDFYAPDFYEKTCPGRPGRIAINKISKLFASNFEMRK